MSTVNPETYGSIMPWTRYNDQANAARDIYQAQQLGAYREYLSGPYPDRPAYEAAERSAWMTYYHACRRAWQEYSDTVMQPPPPAPPAEHPAPTRDAGGEVWPADTPRYDRPTFTQYPGGAQ